MKTEHLKYIKWVLRAKTITLVADIDERKQALINIGPGESYAKTVVTRRLREFERELKLAQETLKSLKEVNP